MSESFVYDVFLSHCSKDKEVVRTVAERLKADGVKVWFDEWELKPGDSIPAKIEEGLEHSRVLVLCMSEHAFGSDWAQLEAGTFRFRDPLNKERRFIPLRLDEAHSKGSLAQFLFIDWRPEKREQEYGMLLDACRPPVHSAPPPEAREQFQTAVLSLGHTDSVNSVALSQDGGRALSGSSDKTVRLWEVESGRCLRVLEGHTGSVWCVALSRDGRLALSSSADKTVCLWEVETGHCLRVLEGHYAGVVSVVLSQDGCHALTGSADRTVRLWEVESGRCLRVLKGHTARVLSVALSQDGSRALSGSEDKTVRFWDVKSGRCLRVIKGHSARVICVVFSQDSTRALSGSEDETVRLWEVESGRCLRVFEGHTDWVRCVALNQDGSRAISGSDDKTLRFWEVESGRCLRVFEGHTDSVRSVAMSQDGRCVLSGSDDKNVRLLNMKFERCLRVFAVHTDWVNSASLSHDGSRVLTGSDDKTMRLWDVESGRCLRVFEGHTALVRSVALSQDGRRALSGSSDNSVRLWEYESGHCFRVFEGHTDEVNSVTLSQDGSRALSGSDDKTVRLWDVESGRCLRVFEGHTGRVRSVALSQDDSRALSGSDDKTGRLWDVESGRCLRVFEGHTDSVKSVALSQNGRRALSGSDDKTVRLWEVKTGRCSCVFEGHTDSIRSVAFSQDGSRGFSGAMNGVMQVWLVKGAGGRGKCDSAQGSAVITTAVAEQVQYTNAKVLLVGDSGVGKSGLSNYLAHNIKVEDDKPLPSTDGAWATHWTLPQAGRKEGVEREILLWDFAGQVDYRLVHQLFMDDTAAAVLVFNPQNENPFDGLAHWQRDLQKAARKPFAKLLVAARIDRGGLVVSTANMEKFIEDGGFLAPLHQTSAKTGEGCDTLREAIVNAIDWKNIPETTSPALYHRMKQEILALRDSGLVLIRLAELKQRMEFTCRGESFDLAQLLTVVGLLAGPGMVTRLDFGGFILLRPEVLSRYAAAVVRKVRKHPQELGCLREDEMLAGDLDYQDFKRLPVEDEDVILRTLHETFIKRAWCLRQACDDTAVLTFPSYFRRERPPVAGHPNVVVTYSFTGPVDEIYATLVVRLHHSLAFENDQLWKAAADFKTQTGTRLGFMLSREAEGGSHLKVYFEPSVDENSRVLFLRYVHDHLFQHARDVVRLRHYACLNKKCERPFNDNELVKECLEPGGSGKVFCPKCQKAIPLRDVIEKKFESIEVKNKVRELQMEGQAVIDNESRELLAVHHTGYIVVEAGQIYRGYTNSDHGIDGEIEFKTDTGQASGKRLYVQLKSGDSYLSKRQRDGAEVFQIKKPRWAEYWQAQAYPVMLVIRTLDGVIRWMDLSAYLKRESNNGKKPVKQIIFKGERFDVMSVRRWRDRVLNAAGGQGHK